MQHVAPNDLQFHNVMPPIASLADDDLRVLACALHGVLEWSFHLHLDYFGRRSLILIPEEDEAAVPALVVTREGQHLTLSSCRFDILSEVATVRSAEEVLPALRAAMQLT